MLGRRGQDKGPSRIALLILWWIYGAIFSASSSAQTPIEPLQSLDSKSWFYITVGVSNLEDAQSFWRDRIGMNVRYTADGIDPDLSRAWRIEDDGVSGQALLSASQEPFGYMHLVEYQSPLPPVRLNAAVYDSLPKSIDFFVDDIEVRSDVLSANGFRFRSDVPQAFEVNGDVVKELQMPGHDETNIVFIENPSVEDDFNADGYVGVGMIITTIDDTPAEQAFFTELLGLSVVTKMDLGGPALEKATGLPSGTQWVIRIVGNQDSDIGQIEFVEYRGLEVENKYQRAVPRALGLTEVTYLRSSLSHEMQYLASNRYDFSVTSDIRVFGHCFNSLRTRSPAGMPVQILEPSDGCA